MMDKTRRPDEPMKAEEDHQQPVGSCNEEGASMTSTKNKTFANSRLPLLSFTLNDEEHNEGDLTLWNARFTPPQRRRKHPLSSPLFSGEQQLELVSPSNYHHLHERRQRRRLQSPPTFQRSQSVARIPTLEDDDVFPENISLVLEPIRLQPRRRGSKSTFDILGV